MAATSRTIWIVDGAFPYNVDVVNISLIGIYLEVTVSELRFELLVPPSHEDEGYFSGEFETDGASFRLLIYFVIKAVDI